jgi:rubredoxin
MQDFYEKHQKVHILKKQHLCRFCGYVYGAAKGLEGHLEAVHKVKGITQDLHITNLRSCQELPFGLGFQFLQNNKILGTLNQTKLAQDSADLLQKAQQAMFVQINQARTAKLPQLSLVPLSINPETIVSPSTLSPQSRLLKSSENKSKIPSPAGTGNYKIYEKIPNIKDAGDAQQNESGFFHCTICTREFSGLNSLKKHVPIHTRRVQHKCDVCGYVFGKKEYLLDHMRKHTGEISPVCQVCGQTFNKSLKLKEHQKLHRNTLTDGSAPTDKPFRCHLCKDIFTTADLLREHLRSKHSETVYKCDMCEASFGDVRGKNHHMYNEHQLDAFHQKCVWCPVCNQGFTRHYNLKVHMYKSHGKEYLENNFTFEELESLMRPPPGTSANKVMTSIKQIDKEENGISSFLPISPPLTPKLLPKQKINNGDFQKTSLAFNPKKRSTLGPASLTKTKYYFEQETINILTKCEVCDLKFVNKIDCDNHFEESHVNQNFDIIKNYKEYQMTRKPGPASRTNPLLESKACSLIDSKNESLDFNESGFQCYQCGKVLMHKQSYVSHMRVIHGDYYGGNKWNGSRVVDMVLGNQSFKHVVLKNEPNSTDTTKQSLTAVLDQNDNKEPQTKRLKLSFQ